MLCRPARRYVPLFSPMESKRILIVENEPILRQWLVKYLRKKGWQVSEASNGTQAYVQIQLSAMQIILTDLLMPRISGFDLIHSLKHDPLLRSIPVIIMTGSPSGALQDLMATHRELRVLFKPFALEDLDRELEAMWGKLQKMQQEQMAQ